MKSYSLIVFIFLSACAQQQTDKVESATSRIAAHNASCKEKTSSMKDLQNCTAPYHRKQMQDAGFPYMDLLDEYLAKRGAIAERADKKRLTIAEAKAEDARVYSAFVDRVRQRDIERSQKNSIDNAYWEALSLQLLSSSQPQAQHPVTTNCFRDNRGGLHCSSW